MGVCVCACMRRSIHSFCSPNCGAADFSSSDSVTHSAKTVLDKSTTITPNEWIDQIRDQLSLSPSSSPLAFGSPLFRLNFISNKMYFRWSHSSLPSPIAPFDIFLSQNCLALESNAICAAVAAQTSGRNSENAKHQSSCGRYIFEMRSIAVHHRLAEGSLK